MLPPIRSTSLALLALSCAAPLPTPVRAPGETLLLQRQARALEPLVRAPWVRRFVEQAMALPDVAPRVLWLEGRARAFADFELPRLSPTERQGLAPKTFDAAYYYETRYGSPLAYARALEVAEPPEFEPGGKRVFDFGYGGIGHLKMLAALGADARGVDVDPLLRALYAFPGDQGAAPGGGSVTLYDGRFPAEPALRAAAGDGYALVVSKNVLKRGYIHPTEPVPDKQVIHLGVDDADFLAAIRAMLVPGGRFLVYNICPGPNRPGKPYVTWADGRAPFPREAFEAAGFRVLAYDVDDLPAVQAMARALGWDKGEGGDPPMDLDHDLQALYTLVEKAPGA